MHAHQLLPVQPVDTGGSIVGRHDRGEDPLNLGNGSRAWVRDLDVFEPESSLLLVEAGCRLVADALLLAARPGGTASFERVAQADAEGVLLISELVNEVTGVAPQREIRVGLGGVEGGAGARLVVVGVVVQQMGRVAASLAGGRGKGVQRDVGRPSAVGVGRNLEDWRLRLEQPNSKSRWAEADARHRTRGKEQIVKAVKTVTLGNKRVWGQGATAS